MHDDYWNEALELVKHLGWHSAELEIQRRIEALSITRATQEDLDAYLLVLCTLQQKFGQLESASISLERLVSSKNRLVSLDASVRFGKVLSQKGKFSDANKLLRGLFPERGNREFSHQPDGVSGSVLWRLGFLYGVAGDYKESLYWFDRHTGHSPDHGSQIANNAVFKNLIGISSGDFDFTNAFELNEKGVFYYLKDSVSIKDVKYVNISKSVVVPLLLNGVVLLSIRNVYASMLQIMLCRRLIQIEGLTFDSEGISEAVHSLKNSRSTIIRRMAFSFCDHEENFIQWVKQTIDDDRLVSYLIGEREVIIKEYIYSRDYSLLSIDSSSTHRRYSINKLPKEENMKKERKVFLIHGHDELNLFRLKEYLSTDLGIVPIVLKDSPSKGKTIIEKFEEHASGCDYAIAIFTKDDAVEKDGKSYLQARPNVIFELGWFYGKIGRGNVLIVFQDGVTIPSDLDGILRIQFADNVLDKSHEIRKEIESS